MLANAVTAAAQRSSTKPHVIRLSVIKSSTSAPTPISAQHGEIDIVLRESGLPITFLKPNFSAGTRTIAGDRKQAPSS